MRNILEYCIQTTRFINMENLIHFVQYSGVSYIVHNYERVMDHVISFDSAFEYLYTKCNIKPFLKKNLFYNISRCRDNPRTLKKVLHLYTQDMSEVERKNFFQEYGSRILEIVSVSSLVALLEYKDIDEVFCRELASKIKKNKEEYIEEIIWWYFPPVQKNQYSDAIFSSFILLIDEILQHEKLDYSDIAILKSGTFSGALHIGSKVFKRSNYRRTYSIPYHPRILQPLIRVNLDSLTPGASKSGYLSVTEFVDTDTVIPEEELYQVYKEFRDVGYIWCDVKYENVGRLKRANLRYWDKNLGDNTGIIKEKCVSEKILGPGEVVVLDDDFIYYENDPEASLTLELAKQFEERYQRDKNNKRHL